MYLGVYDASKLCAPCGTITDEDVLDENGITGTEVSDG